MTARVSPRIPTWLPSLVVGLGMTDVGLTLHGQTPAYWHGEYATAIEANPIAAIFVAWHPLAFVAMATVYLAGVLVAMTLLPRRPACWLALAVVCGHSAGASAWMLRLGAPGMWLAIAFLLVVSRTFAPMRSLAEGGRVA